MTSPSTHDLTVGVSTGVVLSIRRALRLPRWGLARVHGTSMEPTLRPGQLLLIRYDARARAGDMVVVALPPDDAGRARPNAVKRLTRDEGSGGLWVESDNRAAPGALDSWTLGALPPAAFRARVLARLTPPRRTPRG